MAFGTRRITVEVPANGAIDVLAGQAVGQSIEFPGRAFQLSIAAAAEGAGITLTTQLSAELVMDRAVVPVEVAAGRGAVLPDNLLGQFVGASSDRIILRAANGTAGALDINVYVDVQPI